MAVPETRYAKCGELRIAYQVVGNGSVDLVLVRGFISNLDLNWEDPGYCRLMRRLSTFARVIQFDKRGTGLSDRVNGSSLPRPKERMDDIRAIMDAVGSGRAVLLGSSEGAGLAILFAANYSTRTRALLLYGGYAHFQTSVMGQESLEEFIRNVEAKWGSGASLAYFGPSRAKDARFQAWWGRFERLSASPAAASALLRMNAQVDVRDILGSVHVPTLVLHRREDVWAKALQAAAIWLKKSRAPSSLSCRGVTIRFGAAKSTAWLTKSRNSSPGSGRCQHSTACC